MRARGAAGGLLYDGLTKESAAQGMGVSTGRLSAFHQWYGQQPGGNIWADTQSPNSASQFHLHMPDQLQLPRFEWTYEADTKTFAVVQHNPALPLPTFNFQAGQQHILSNPLDPMSNPLNEHLVAQVRSTIANAPQMDQFVLNETSRYRPPVETYPAQVLDAATGKLQKHPVVQAWSRQPPAAGGPAPRFEHHLMVKHNAKYQKHVGAMVGHTRTRQQMTEVRGEFAAAKFAFLVLARSENDYHLKLGMNSPYTQGIDQIWVRRDPATGNVTEYVLVEAKGSAAARLGQTKHKGAQMSPRWAMRSIVELRNVGTTQYPTFADGNLESLTTKIMHALLRIGTTVPVWGLVVQCKFSNKNPSFHLRIRDANEFHVDN